MTDTQPIRFEDLGLSEPTLRAIGELGYEEPTPIQARTIARMLEGVDLIAQAQTGTGKTAAFALPIIERLEAGHRSPQALVMTPTRELAVQVAEAFHAYGKFNHVTILPVYGGQPIERQLRALDRGVQVVVGTPGRLLDHIRRGTLKLDSCAHRGAGRGRRDARHGLYRRYRGDFAGNARHAPDRAVLGDHAGADRAPGRALSQAIRSASPCRPST